MRVHFVFVLLLCLDRCRRCQNVILDTPCPSVLKYLPLEAVDEEAWQAEIHLSTEDDLQGVWLHVVLDKKANTLLNWFGESTTLDNQEYAIRKPEYKLSAGPSIVVKIKVTYNAAEAPPIVNHLRLNGRTICALDKKLRSTESPPFVSLNKKELKVTEQEDIDDGLLPAKEPAKKPAKEEVITSRSTTVTHTKSSTRTELSSETSEGEAEAEEFFTGDLAHILASSTNVGRKKNLARTFHGPRLRPGDDIHCGVPVKRVVPLITNGRPSIEGAWPWHVAIYTLSVLQLKYTCGGSLLTKTHVITAAHCVATPRTSQPADSGRFLIHLGRTQLTHFNVGLQQRQVDHIVIHPGYNHTNYRNDLAVLTLADPADYTDYVRPICLTTDSYSTNLTNQLGTVVGWGFDQHNNITELLHETEMPVVDLLTCVYSEPEVYSKLTSTNNFCAGFKNGTSVCNGDSGGGMFFEREVDSGLRWELRGMVSFSVASRNDLCNPNAYAVFTDVLKYRPWIKQQIKTRRSRSVRKTLGDYIDIDNYSYL